MDSREIILVTGANTGLGFEIVKALYSSNKGYNVLLAGRSLDKAQNAVKSIIETFPSSNALISPIQIDIEDDVSIQKAFEVVQTKFGRLDALVNNAGAQFDQAYAIGTLTMRDMWNHTWNTNTTSTQVLTTIFVPLLLRSSSPCLLFLASGTSSLSDTTNTSIAVNRSPGTGWPKEGFSVAAYRSAKTGLNMMMREWWRLLNPDGVRVWAVSPGFLATGLGGDIEVLKKMGAGDPSAVGGFVRKILEGERDGDVGLVITREGVQDW